VSYCALSLRDVLFIVRKIQRISPYFILVRCIDRQSKLGNILIAKEFQKRYDKLESVSLHPGAIYTSLYRDTGIVSALKLSVSMIPAALTGNLLQMLPKPPSAGAATTITCSTLASDELTNGGYYSNCCLAQETAAARNEEDAAALFDFCDQFTSTFQ
jgi:hypothetical protein